MININKDTGQNAFCLISRKVQNGSYFTLPFDGRYGYKYVRKHLGRLLQNTIKKCY